MKKRIKLTEGNIRRIIRMTIHNVLSEEFRISNRRRVNEETDNLSGVQSYVDNLRNQIKELARQESGLTSKINKMKSVPVDTPEDFEKRQAAIDEFTNERASIRKKKIKLNQEVREFERNRKNKEVDRAKRLRDKGIEIRASVSEKPKISKEIADKRKWSGMEASAIEANEYWEKKYQSLISDGYLIFPKAKRAMLLSGGKKKFYTESISLEKFLKFIEKNHPDKKLKQSLIPRKKERKQLDDVAYFDVKVTLEDNIAVNQENNNTITFSKKDVPYDNSTY
jgi:hypothetical protein